MGLVPSGIQGRSPGRRSEGSISLQKLKNFSKFNLKNSIAQIKRSFYCDFVINEYNVSID